MYVFHIGEWNDPKAFIASYSEYAKTATVRRRLHCISAILNYAYYEYDIEKRNPFARVIIKGEVPLDL